MTRRELKNVAASVHARLLDQARQERRRFDELLQYYAMERFLFRLSRSTHIERFVLKGALMLRTHADFYDLWFLAGGFHFEGDRLCRATETTFARRKTDLPADAPIALTPAFADEPTKQRQWDAFLRKTRIKDEGPSLPRAIERIATFLMPPTAAIAEPRPYTMQWPPGGPWNPKICG